MQQLYAKIKKSSKYFYQNDFAKRDGEFPFAIAVRNSGDEYCVVGGPGGAYRLADLNLFVIDNDREIRIR